MTTLVWSTRGFYPGFSLDHILPSFSWFRVSHPLCPAAHPTLAGPFQAPDLTPSFLSSMSSSRSVSQPDNTYPMDYFSMSLSLQLCWVSDGSQNLPWKQEPQVHSGLPCCWLSALCHLPWARGGLWPTGDIAGDEFLPSCVPWLDWF